MTFFQGDEAIKGARCDRFVSHCIIGVWQIP
ncbi:hypothetical protein M879_12440 [Mycobacteroides abscessus V06705]|nr:hypothetical protein M879_12440 [Mycobacteroides abscessus V06705]